MTPVRSIDALGSYLDAPGDGSARYVEATGWDAWELALSVVLRLGRDKAAGFYPKRSWATPFRVVGRRWFELAPDGGYTERSRDWIETIVRRWLERHFRMRHGEPVHIGVSRRLVAAVTREIAGFPCVRKEDEAGGVALVGAARNEVQPC
jgi:hypothetical protein